jgi:glycosyltransferase involved in cell wall biosynthesis
MARAVYVTATEPEPRSFGKRIVMGGILDHLCERLGPANVHLVLLGPAQTVLPSTPYQLHFVAKPRAHEQARAVLQRVLLPPNTSLQEAAVFSPRVMRAVARIVDEIDPDLEVWDTVRLGQYVSRARAPKRPSRAKPTRRLLYLDDLFSERYRSMLRSFDGPAHTALNPGGEFQKLLPRATRGLLSRPWVYRPLLQLEQRLVARSECQQPCWFDTTLLVSDSETALLRRRLAAIHGADAPRVETIPPLLRQPRAQPRLLPSRPRFVFLGGLDFAPNADALVWFLRSCREPVLAALPDVELLVIGRGTERPLAEAQAWGDRIRWCGWVEELETELARCTALLSPLRVGSGVKIKVLEALARGLPVVGTLAGVQGVESPESSGCLVADSPETLAAMMLRAHDPAENARLSRAARACWQRTYTASAIRHVYDDLLGTASSA